MTGRYIEVIMSRHLDGELPPPKLPRGYHLRWYQAGDEEAWLAIHRRVGIYDPVSPDLFTREFGEHLEALAERQCFIEDARGNPVGTATAWLAGTEHKTWEGRVHWVAVVPEHQRRGLGKYLTLAVCERLRELGARTAYLTTGADNLPAIRLYLGLGFRPEGQSGQDAVL